MEGARDTHAGIVAHDTQDTYEALPSVWKGSNGGLVVQISAAEDAQKAIDATQPSGRASGAATYSLMVALTQYKFKITWARLLIEMHKALDSKDRFGLRPTTGKLGEVCSGCNGVQCAMCFPGYDKGCVCGWVQGPDARNELQLDV